MRKWIATAWVLVTLCNVGASGADLDVAAKLPADTRLLVHARLNAILESPLGSIVNLTHDIKLGEIRKFVRQHIGLDLDRVEDIWVLSCKPDTGVIVLKGDLGAGEIPLVFGQSPDVTEVFREDCPFVAKFKDEKKGTMQLGAVIDENTVAFGDIPSVNHYLDVVAGKSEALPGDNSQLCAFRRGPDLIAATILGNLAEWGDFDADLAAALRNIRLDVDADDDVHLRLTLEAVDARQAEGFELTIKGLLILKGESQQLKAKGLLYSLARRVSVKRQGSTVTVDSMLPGDDVEGMAAELLK